MASARQENIKETTAFFSAIIESAIDAIAIIDEHGSLELANPALCKLFGYTRDELRGEKVNVLMPSFHATRHDDYIANYVQTGVAQIIGIGREVQGRRKDGTLFPIRLAVSEVSSEGGRFFVGFMQDLTEIKEAEAAILKLNEELEAMVATRTEELSDAVNTLLEINTKLSKEIRERNAVEKELRASREELEASLAKEKELNELKSRFVSMASHEFRTPLSTILSSSALIGRYAEGDQQPKREKHLDRIKNAVSGLNSILNDFLSISKIEEGRIPITIQELKVGDICAEVIGDIEGLLKEEQKIEHQDLSGNITLQTDKNILKNILFNLTSNAIKYSGEGTTVNCTTEKVDDVLQISIKDQGMGIPKHDQKHLFSRFFRASNVTNIQGTGLGLNIVAGYVKMLNGEIDFESEPDVGSTFIVRIPINTQDG